MTVSKSPEDERREQQRMQDILVLLQHLAENEETTIKLIIECLYDVGAVNFINREVENPAINQLTKKLASVSKPVAKRYGLYWFKKNCPELIVNWLRRKVAFPPPQKAPPPKVEVEAQPDIIQAVEVAEVQAQSENLPSAGAVSQTSEESYRQSIEADPSLVTDDNNSQSTADLDITTDDPTDPAVPFTPLSLENLPIALDPSVADRANSKQQPIASTQIVAGEDSIALEKSRSTLSELEHPPSLAANPDTNVEQDLPLTVPLFQTNSTELNATEVNSRQLSDTYPPIEPEARQIRRLRTQVKVLAGTLVGTTLMSGAMIWHLYATPSNSLDLRQSIPSSIVPSEQDED